MSKVLSFKDVTLKFGGITALNSVSFDVNPGELYAIITVISSDNVNFLIKFL